MRRGCVLIALLGLIASEPAAADGLREIRVDELEILGVYTSSFGPAARVRGARHEGVLAMREGDRLIDGRVAWIGFLSHRLAVVRLKQRVWPPDPQMPYREVLRVLGWASMTEKRPPAQPSLPLPRGTLLAAVGPEGLGSWPEGRYSNPHESLVEHVEGERLPRVDLFAAVFHEIYGLFPWQHKSWRQGGWTVEQGFPLRGSIVGLAQDEPRPPRDPFRSLTQPWTLLDPSSRPQGIGGLSIDDIELEAFYETAEGPVVEVRSGDSFQPWTLRPGDQLWDSDVVSIVPFGGWPSRCGEVTFQQLVRDETGLKPFAAVVKVKSLTERHGRCF